MAVRDVLRPEKAATLAAVTPELWHIPYSPWSLKARCALRLRAVNVRERIYTPLLTEPLLRARLRSWGGTLTVPVLFTEQVVLRDSWDIARHAEQVGSGPSLFPEGRQAEVQAWNDCSERLLSAGRNCAMLRVLLSPEAAMESLPPAMRTLGAGGARLAVRVFNRKYGIHAESEEAARSEMRRELSTVRAALSDGRAHLLGDFSYADVTIGLALQLVKPLPDSPMGPSTLRTATEPGVASEFADVLAYRDALHEKYRLLPT